MESHYATDLQVAVMQQDVQQCGSKGREEGDCLLMNMIINMLNLKYFTNQLCKCFLRKCIQHLC